MKVPLFIFVPFAVFCSSLQAQDQPWTPLGPTQLTRTESYDFPSESTGRTYRIWVHTPENYDEEKEYPVVYALDAVWDMTTYVGTIFRIQYFNEALPEVILVGIGYEDTDAQIRNRTYDMTWTESAWVKLMQEHMPNWAPEGAGDANNFHTFLKHELMPQIERRYNVSSTERTLVGHSLGGLFVLHSLFRDDRLFRRYVALSPSLWWGKEALFQQEAEFATRRSELAARLFISMGALEPESIPEFEPEVQTKMVSNAKKLKRILEHRDYEKLDWDFQIFPDEDHNSVVPASISRGLRSVFEGWNSEDSKPESSAYDGFDTEGKVSTNGLEIYYRIFGQGEPLLLIHGFNLTGRMWEPYIETFGSKYQLIIPDMRGHGQSTNPKGEFTHRHSAQDMLALLDELAIDQCRAMGFSSGAGTIMEMAVLQPERLEAMVLVDGAHRFSNEARKILKDFNFDTFQKAMPWWANMTASWHADGFSQSRRLAKNVRGMGHNPNDLNLSTEQLNNIEIPTLLIFGDKDDVVPIEVVAELHGALPNSHLWVMPDVGHEAVFAYHYRPPDDPCSPCEAADQIFPSTVLQFLEN